jgi:stearoyl-CoA desaturase (Delta-9 desaturase)
MLAIAIFFVAHWVLSVFCQTFFLHRYGAHRMFTMSKGWEKFFFGLTWFTQGSSFLIPRGYAILHREHHAFSDTERDPHSPHIFKNLWTMMWATKERYEGMHTGRLTPEARFDGGYPEWPWFERIANSWTSRIGFGVAYTVFYIVFAPHWAFFLLLPIHYVMGPVHGAIVNWCGHMYGYRNFETSNDKSRNSLPFDFVTMGELFQNNHHRYGMSPNFAARWFEVDPTYPVIWVLNKLGVIQLRDKPQKMRWSPAEKLPVPVEVSAPLEPAVLDPAE